MRDASDWPAGTPMRGERTASAEDRRRAILEDIRNSRPDVHITPGMRRHLSPTDPEPLPWTHTALRLGVAAICAVVGDYDVALFFVGIAAVGRMRGRRALIGNVVLLAAATAWLVVIATEWHGRVILVAMTLLLAQAWRQLRQAPA